MKDMLGVEVEVGDVIVSTSGQGSHKIGKVYGFTRKGELAMIEAQEVAYDVDKGKYTLQWRKVRSGYSVLVIGREKLGTMQPTDETWNAIQREYPSELQ